MTAKENLDSPENAKVEERGSTIKVPPLPDHYAENRLVRIMGTPSPYKLMPSPYKLIPSSYKLTPSSYNL